MTRKGNIVLWIALAVLGAILAVGGGIGVKYALTPKSQPQPKEQVSAPAPTPAPTAPQVAEDETANWKTFRDDKLGFEFKYPQEIAGEPVRLEITTPDEMFLYHNALNFYSSGQELVAHFYLDAIDMKSLQVTTGIDLGGSGGRAYDPKRQAWYDRDNPSKMYSWDEMFQYLGSGIATVSGQIAFLQEIASFGTTETTYQVFDKVKPLYVGLGFSYASKAEGGTNPQEIAALIEEDKKTEKQLKELLRKMVETMEISPQVETANWKVYRNEKYGFEFKYPQTFSFTELSIPTNSNSLLEIKVEGINFQIIDKQKIAVRSFESGGPRYDVVSNTWYVYSGEEENCPMNLNSYPIYKTVFGDAGYSLNLYYLISDKSYAIQIADESSDDRSYSENVNKILESFKLIGDTRAISFVCKPVI